MHIGAKGLGPYVKQGDMYFLLCRTNKHNNKDLKCKKWQAKQEPSKITQYAP